MELGLLFECRLAKVEMDKPIALLVRRGGNGPGASMDVVPPARQTPAQRETVRQLQPRAERGWWESGHGGWTLFPVDSEQYAALGGNLATIPLAALTGAGAAAPAPAPAPAPPPALAAGALPTASDLITMMNATGPRSCTC
ncbi:hypothetical protein MNEG_16121 [Monoraphidium neglectum]|uniref:Uncharacterized protein n=1 Tax=Monoraphidium neglectum TaxID=145388 RepID=A0A0D2K6M7_9CHLO|nr:hypothetical protein MNEG_16121 [Monoraphidium neglectum]KIY91843.1 hypothetical protein MNEG_16121 [Monoraphidium neglectum]|eukprot:XP_013890863.1 hypothetical protein MNEG_16121 [Monoraphidium neglectum]